jgi:hypothetical protein
MAAPHQTITKTAAKTNEAELCGAVKLKIDESKRQTNKGPQRSPGGNQKKEVNRIKITFTKFLKNILIAIFPKR